MVDQETPTPPRPNRPFAARALLYTAGFLLVILGVVPSLFYLAGDGLLSPLPASQDLALFWSSLRALVGVTVFAMGFGAYIVCSLWLIFYGRGPHVEFDPPTVFVATGPYRWVRNPVVICLLVTVLGEAIFLNSFGILILFVAGLPLAHYQVTRIEEPRLRQRFGRTYEDYCAEVPRWLPRPPRVQP